MNDKTVITVKNCISAQERVEGMCLLNGFGHKVRDYTDKNLNLKLKNLNKKINSLLLYLYQEFIYQL